MLSTREVAVVGLGLMGGSLAMALRGSVARLVAVETDSAARNSALGLGLVDAATEDLAQGIATADLVILATPVSAILETLRRLPEVKPEGCLVLDIGSTKRQIVAAMDELPRTFSAMGMHPLCGKESSGIGAASGDLFEGQPLALCRSGRTSESALEAAWAVGSAVGAHPFEIEASIHDAVVAATSHVPYLVASALMALGQDRTQAEKRGWELSASGFRDMTRLAGSSPAMMLDIVASNSDEVARSLRQHVDQMESVLAWIDTHSWSELEVWLGGARDSQRRYRREKWGASGKHGSA